MWITWVYLNTLWSIAKDVYLNKYSKSTHYYLFNCYIVFHHIIVWKLSQQIPQAALHFRSCKYRSRPLPTMRYPFPGCLWGLVSLVECLKSRLERLALKYVDGRYARFLIGKETPPSRQSLLRIVSGWLFMLQFTQFIWPYVLSWILRKWLNHNSWF